MRHFLRQLSLVVILSQCLWLIPSVVAANERIFVAVVDVATLLQKSPQSEAATAQLKERFLPQEKALDIETKAIELLEENLKKEKPLLTREEAIIREREIRQRRRTLNRDLENYREDFRLERTAALDEVQRQVFEAIDKVRALKNIDIVIQDHIVADKRVNITQAVLDYLVAQFEEAQQQQFPEKEP